MITQSYLCDVCAAMKRETNHWILADFSGVSIQFLPWHEETARFHTTKHLCGHECAMKLLQEWMSEYAQTKAKGGGVVIRHEEHAPHTIPPGNYEIVRQVEDTEWGKKQSLIKTKKETSICQKRSRHLLKIRPLPW